MVGVLALAACSGGGEANETAGNEAGGGGGGSAGVSMQPGEWEMTVTATRIEMAGLPGGSPLPPPQTARNCITPEQAASVTGAVIRNTGQNGECTTQSNTAGNGRIQATVQCRAPQGSTVQFAIDGQYTATTMELTQQIRTTGGPRAMEMDMRTTGRRVGDCPAGAAQQPQNQQ
jgi:hypothetical protein